MRNRSMDAELRERARQVIPNGMYGHESVRLLPAEFPQFFKSAKGARIRDVDDNEYIDYICAYGPNLFGYGHEAIERAASAQRELGDTMNGPGAPMVEFAEAMVAQITHADWAMFCKNGSDATSMALVVARAYRGKRKILVAKGTYHGAAPWCTPYPGGILPEDRAHIVYFDHNDEQSLADAVRANEGDIAGIIATPFRHEVFADQFEPGADYAATARRLCDEADALLIIDEVRAGFRLARDCSWAKFGIEPDLTCWGKCIANGHPISALLGSEKVRKAATEIFVTGSFWFSAVPMAAGVETLRQIRETGYLERTDAMGQKLRDGLYAQADAHGFSIRQTGPVVMPQVLFDEDPTFKVGYGWTSECLKRGVYIHPYHNMFMSDALTEADMDMTLAATDLAFEALKRNFDTLEVHPILATRLGH